jgi:predicted HAD superfamily phosphohydrolase YqeG
MGKSWLEMVWKLVVLTTAIGVPFVAFRIMEGDKKKKADIAFAFWLAFEGAIGAIIHSASYPVMNVFLFLSICATIGGFSMSIAGWFNVLRREEYEKICPNLLVEDISETKKYLQEWFDRGFRVFACDLEHTLLSPGEKRVVARFALILEEADRIGFVVAIITNTIVPIREKQVKQVVASLRIVVICVCCNFLRCKPHRYGFDEVCRVAKVPPEKVVYVGDMLHRDMGGARKAGYGLTVMVRPHGRTNIWVLWSRWMERKFRRWLKEIGHHSLQQ